MIDVLPLPIHPPIIYAAESVDAVAYREILNKMLETERNSENKLTLNGKGNLVPIAIGHFRDSLSLFWHEKDQSYQL